MEGSLSVMNLQESNVMLPFCYTCMYRYLGVDFSVLEHQVSDCFTLQVSQCQTWVTPSSPRHSSMTVTTGGSSTSSRPSSVYTNWCYPHPPTCLGFSYKSGKCPGPKSFLSASCWGWEQSTDVRSISCVLWLHLYLLNTYFMDFTTKLLWLL